jgi:3-keto-disaccharide hydrolase
MLPLRSIVLVAITLAVTQAANSQTPVQPYPFAPPPGPQIYPHPLADSNEGFQPIFDGTLKNWDGDPQYWRVENGILVGEVTPNNLLKQNSFLIWRGGAPKDFELKAEFRISGHGNSGINYRSAEISGTKWLLRGYQADIDGADKYTGQNYEERGRTFLAMRGQVTHVDASGPTVIASLGTADELKAFIRPNDWNEYHLIIRGNVLIHILNGHIMSEVIDDDTVNRKFDGLIGVQVHVGPPMKIEYRSILLKPLP